MENSRKILLIYPQSPAIRLNQEGYLLPPTDLMYMASVAELVGLEARIRDYNLGGDFEKDLAEFRPDYIVAEISTQTFLSDIGTVARAKQLLPNVTTIVKGIPFLTYNTNVIYENEFIDYVFLGEGELTLKEILEHTPNSEIKGICYRENFQGVKNEMRPFNENLDSLPFPARHLINNSIYKGFNKKPQAVIEISRGCPNNCFFCLETPLTGEKNRIRSIENIIAEIQECVKKYNIKNFLFKSNSFNFDKAWSISFCKKIIESGLKITWTTNILANSIDKELVFLMAKSGCKLVNIKVISGSQEILNNTGLNITLDEIRQTTKLLKKHKIKTYNHFILGLPWETEKTVNETIKFSIELDSDYINFLIAPPFPGTRFFAYAMINKLVEPNINFENAYIEPIARSHELSKERLYELHKQATKSFYKRAKYILKNLLLCKLL